MSKKGRQRSNLAFSQGPALISIAETYPTLLEVLLEAVQNALDSGATKIWINVNRQIRQITIQDNGRGVTEKRFEDALQSVCETIKPGDKLGRFGRGLVAPLGKCDSFIFTSCAQNKAEYLEWTFDTEDIRDQRKRVRIPKEKQPDLRFRRGVAGKEVRGKTTPVKWRTQILIRNFTKDRMISKIGNINNLVSEINDRYQAVLRKNKVALSITIISEDGSIEDREDIRAYEFSGKALGEAIITNDDGGKTIFRLYVLNGARSKGSPKGKVLIGEIGNDFRLRFTSSRCKGLLDPEIVSALTSGIFEGEILSESAELHSNRRGFVENDALVGFCEAIEEWYQEYGYKYIQEIEDTQETERYQDLGLQSLTNLEKLLKNPDEFPSIIDLIRSFKYGTVGSGHVEPGKDRVKDQTTTTKATRGIAPKGKRRSPEGPRTEPTRHIKGHVPLTVAGPGTQRTVVRHHSFGLQLVHSAMEGNSRLWDLDTDQGILYLNIRHPHWVSCEDKDRDVMRLQEYLAIQALNFHAMPANWQTESHRTLLDEEVKSFVFLLRNSQAFTGARKPRAR
ncbi:ATP-binding protein [Patescibacteria group bacterium]